MLFALCSSLLHAFPDAVTLAAYLASLLLAFLIGFHFEACIGAVGFWLLEVSSLLYIINTLNYFISGHMFPIDLLGEPWATVLKVVADAVPGVLPGGGVPRQGAGARIG